MMPEHLAAQWARCRAWLIPALDGDSEEKVAHQVASGFAQLWPGERSAMVTQCLKEPPQLHVWLAGGDLEELLRMIPAMSAWGRAMGLRWATINGRSGWARVLRGHGFVLRDGELWKALG